MIRPLRILVASAAMLAATAAAAYAAPPAIGHRGANTSTVPENTLAAMKYATPYASKLEADIRWTKDSDDADTVGTIVTLHDSTLDRTTNCSGYIKDRLWGYVRDNCRTDIGKQSVLKLTDLVAYAKSANRPILFHMKVAMSSAQAKQFWSIAKTAPSGSVLAGSASMVAGIQKVKSYDAASTAYRLRYGYETSSNPSVSTIKAVGPYLVIKSSEVSASKVAYYKDAGLTVWLWTGKTEADYASMVAKKPHAVIVDDAKRYQQWATQ